MLFLLRTCFLAVVLPFSLAAEDFRIPLLMPDAGTTEEVPLYVGVPFPKGWNVEAVDIVDGEGGAVPCSSRVMARWPEQGGVRWLGVDFVGSPGKEYFVVPASGRSQVAANVTVKEEAEGFVVDTGAARFALPKKGALLQRVWLGDALLIENAAGGDLYVVDQEGTVATIGGDAAEGQLRHEVGGEPALRAVFRREGWYVTAQGERVARHVTRLHFYAGRSEVKVEHSLILTENTDKRWFREYGLRLVYADAAKAERVFVPEGEAEDAPVLEVPLSGAGSEVHLFQEKAFHMTRTDLEKDCHFQIGKSGALEAILRTGSLAGNWMLTGNARHGVGVAVRNFWQMWPKELSGSRDGMTVRLWSARGGKEMDFRSETIIGRWPEEWFNEHYAEEYLMDRIRKIDTNASGLARSHDLLLCFSKAPNPRDMAAAAARMQASAVCVVAPEWLRFTEAMGKFHPYDPRRFPDEEAFMEEWFDQHMAIWRQWGDTGFFEFGNWPHVWFRKAVKGPLEGRWHAYVDRYSAMMDYGFYANAWRAFARSGKRKYFDAAEETTRHRLDMGMAHWDGLAPDAALPLNRHGGIRRLKGAYTFSNSPIVWAGGSVLHHNSGTDIRALAYLYYLTDYRPAVEMLRDYATAVKRLWNTGNLGPFRGTRPFASLKNLATAYQETGDPELKKIIHEQVEWLADLDAPQGVSREKEATGLGKYGVKAGAMHRVHEVLGDELAAKSLLRGATTRATTLMGEGPFSYVNVEGEQLSEGLRLTGDPLFARALLRNMAVAVSEFRDPDTGMWKPMWDGVGPSASANAYPLGGMAFAMDAVAEYEKATGKKVELTPFVRQSGFGPPTLAVVKKPEGKAVELDVRGNRELAPVVYDAGGKRVADVGMKPWTAQLYSLTASATRWLVTLPAKLPAGDYFLDGGGGGAMWEITWTDAPHAVLYVPRGFVVGPGGRQWGNRIMQGDTDHNAPVYFLVPEDCESFEIAASIPCRLKSPDGAIVNAGKHSRVWERIPVADNQRGKLWELFSPSANFIELRGVPPFVAYGDAGRYFLPQTVPDAFAKPPAPVADLSAGSEPLFTANAPVGQPAHGILLSGKRRLEIPNATRVQSEQGTIEFWLMPRWRSVDHFLRSNQRTVMDGGSWKIFLHRFGELSVTATVEPESSKPALETNAGILLEPGIWTHIALQWRNVEGRFHWELFVNGRKQVFGIGDAGMAAVVEKFTPKAADATLIFGGTRSGSQPLDAGLGGLRFSSEARYDGNFEPEKSATMQKDSKTTGLFLFEKGHVGDGKLID